MDTKSNVSVQTGRTTEVIEFCIEDECAEPGVVTIAVDDEPASYQYRVVVETHGERIDTAGTVATESFELNGPGCEPRTANAIVKIAPDGSARILYPDPGR